MDRIDKQRACSDVNKKECKINKTSLKWCHLKHLHVSKEVPIRHHYGKSHQTPLGKSAWWGICTGTLKCLYTNAHSMGNQHEKLEICVLLQGYDLVGITETW